jgi:hypothetical protein
MSNNQHDLSTHHDQYGIATAAMVNETFVQDVQRGVLLMRHSAREFRRDIHDLENPLTDHGRGLAKKLGENLSAGISCRAYASPPHRCIETAEFVLAGVNDGRQDQGLEMLAATKVRPLEALGVFYALDQIRMWKGLRSAGGLSNYIQTWFDGEIAPDVMMRPRQAVAMVLEVMLGKLDATPLEQADVGKKQLDLCVTHDMTVYTVRHGAGLESLADAPVDFLDGLLLYRDSGVLMLKSHYGNSVEVTKQMLRG